MEKNRFTDNKTSTFVRVDILKHPDFMNIIEYNTF